MDNQHFLFIHSRLERKLKERRSEVLNFIASLDQRDVLDGESGLLSKIIQHSAIEIPALLMDSIEADRLVIEPVDGTLKRKSGSVYFSFFIPIRGESEWLEEIEEQTEKDQVPIAFLEKKRTRIDIKLELRPEDKQGALKEKLHRRCTLIQCYANEVRAKIAKFNDDLAEAMTFDFNMRKDALVRAYQELQGIGLPLIHNPQHEERTEQIQRLLRRLSERGIGIGQNSTEQALLSVLAAIDDISADSNAEYVGEEQIVQRTGIGLKDVRDYMDLLALQGKTTANDSLSSHRSAATTFRGRITLKDPNFNPDTALPAVHNYSGVQSVNHGSGSISGNIQNINSTLENVAQTVNQSSHLQQDERVELAGLIKQLSTELQQVPAERADEAQALSEATKELVEKADKEKPNLFSMRITGDGLQAAAKNLASAAPNVVTTISKIVTLVLKA